jgi:hypothetical protein
LKHINNTHNPNTYAQQLKFKPVEAALKELEGKSFFNSSWNSTQIENAVNYGYNEALRNGISTGQYVYTYAGETVTVALNNGAVQTAWGDYIYTFEQLMSLLG